MDPMGIDDHHPIDDAFLIEEILRISEGRTNQPPSPSWNVLTSREPLHGPSWADPEWIQQLPLKTPVPSDYGSKKLNCEKP